MDSGTYERLYEAQARAMRGDDAIGDGDFDQIGRFELEALRGAGLRPYHTLLDFGCGVGRLAVHVVPYLSEGAYIGVDISETFLRRAEERIRRLLPGSTCRISWVKQVDPHFPFPDASVDFLCAFSVFTHMEAEDNYRYLSNALRVARPGGRLVFTALLLPGVAATDIFMTSAAQDMAVRWSRVRNVVTTEDFMSHIARCAGWIPLSWRYGEPQSTCVLEKPASSP